MSNDEYDSIKNTWLVVHFVEENSVEIVPKKWYISSISSSYWPGDDIKVSEAIKKWVSPQPLWKAFSVKVLGEYDDFNKATRKVIKAKTGDILSSDSSLYLKKTIPIKKKFSSSSDEKDYPDIPRKRIKQKKIFNSTCNTITKAQNHLEPDRNYSKSLTAIEHNVGTSTPPATNNETTVCQKQILKLLHTLNYQMDNVQSDVNILLKRGSYESTQVFPKKEVITKILKSMPFNTKNNIDDLENLTENQLNLLAQELSLIGGDSIQEMTKTLMYKILTNKLGSTYTWEGLKNKHCFKVLKLAQIIITAVRLNVKTENASELDIIKVIKAWLLRAKERLENSNKKSLKLVQ